MKRNTILLLVLSLLSGIIMPARAQQAKTPRFIENIEVVPKGCLISTTNVTKPILAVINNAATAPIVAPDELKADAIEKCTRIQFKYALLMNREVESMSNTALYGFIDDWMKTPYRYGGCSRDGIDCSSFVATLMQQVYGIGLPRSSKEQYSKCLKIDRTNLQEGDLVFFHTFKGVSHVGVYLGDNYFVHSSTHSGVTIDNLNEEYYNKRYIGGGRMVK